MAAGRIPFDWAQFDNNFISFLNASLLTSNLWINRNFWKVPYLGRISGKNPQ